MRRDRIEQQLGLIGITQADLARAVGATPSAISQLIAGKTKSSRLLPKIAKLLRVSEDYLTGASDDPFLPVSGTMTPAELAHALKAHLAETMVMIGTDVIQIVDGNIVDDDSNQLFDPFWIEKRVREFDNNIAQLLQKDPTYIPPTITKKTISDAMSPTVNKGDEVTFSLATTDVNEADGIWLFSYGGLLMMRRLTPLPFGKGYRISGDNPAVATFEAPVDDVQVLGKAFWIGRTLS